MKFKNWVSITLLIISSIFMFMIFTEPFILNWIGVAGTLSCTLLLAKYSKFCDTDNIRK